MSAERDGAGYFGLGRDTLRVRTNSLLHGATKPVTIDRFPAREMDE